MRDHGSQPLDAVLRSILEYAATGRPLPRVTVTDDSVPSTYAACRPISAATWLPSDGARPAADRL
jgi:gamma-glutamyltranspeptidase/glutathione hydrolase